MQRLFIIAGIVLVVLGLAWPWMSRIPLGRLPGDIFIDKPGLKIYIPIASMIIISIVVSLILWILRK